MKACIRCGQPSENWPLYINGQIFGNGCYKCFLQDRQNDSLHISSKFKPNYSDAVHAEKLIQLGKTPAALLYFDSIQNELSHYGYWYFLGTLWVDYSGWTNLDDWKRLFSSMRPKKRQCLMKPYEVVAYDMLPPVVTLFRAHRQEEHDWIAYTLDQSIAVKFAAKRGVNEIKEYTCPKEKVLCLFLRRGEKEALVLDKQHATFMTVHKIGD